MFMASLFLCMGMELKATGMDGYGLAYWLGLATGLHTLGLGWNKSGGECMLESVLAVQVVWYDLW